MLLTLTENFLEMKKGDKVALSNNGADEIRISDWTNPEKPVFGIATMHNSRVSFDMEDAATGMTITGYIRSHSHPDQFREETLRVA